MEPQHVVLGMEYKDTNTGFTGIAVARTEWQNGCWRVSLEHLKDDAPKSYQFDVEQLEPTEKTVKKLAKKNERREPVRSGGDRSRAGMARER